MQDKNVDKIQRTQQNFMRLGRQEATPVEAAANLKCILFS